MDIRNLTDDQFDREILESHLPVLVEFYLEWTGSCILTNTLLMKIQQNYSTQLAFYRINIHEQQKTSEKYGIVTIPAILFFYNGCFIDSLIGTYPKTMIETKIQQVLTSI